MREEGGEATVKWIDRRENTYQAAQVQPFLKILEKRRSGFRRSELSKAIYNRELLRLSDKRLQEMQRYLRKHGIRFTGDWGSPDFRIRLHRDVSVILGGSKQPETKLSGLLPQWLVPVSVSNICQLPRIIVRKDLPQGVSYRFLGESRQALWDSETQRYIEYYVVPAVGKTRLMLVLSSLSPIIFNC